MAMILLQAKKDFLKGCEDAERWFLLNCCSYCFSGRNPHSFNNIAEALDFDADNYHAQLYNRRTERIRCETNRRDGRAGLYREIEKGGSQRLDEHGGDAIPSRMCLDSGSNGLAESDQAISDSSGVSPEIGEIMAVSKEDSISKIPTHENLMAIHMLVLT